MSNQPIEVAIGIIYQYSPLRFLMQLRDDIPSIIFPGHWALFGGHIEPGETPEIAFKRELKEEIDYFPRQSLKFGSFPTPRVIRHVYSTPLEVEFEQLKLQEGLDMAWLGADDIRRGHHYSPKIDEHRPLAAPQRQILLDFINQNQVN